MTEPAAEFGGTAMRGKAGEDGRTDLRVDVTFWNRWITPRFERTADGTAALYFGLGRLTWNRKRPQPPGPSDVIGSDA